MPIDICPDCGKERTAGLCPRCVLKMGLDAPKPDDGAPDITFDLPRRPGSVLGTIAATVGAVPRVLLRDTDVGEAPSPILRPTPGEDATLRYRIDGEIARGGMGAVLKGRDPDLGRDVAIKVLLEGHGDNAEMVRRFVEEAQIGGQLQHPGVVPIYELGTFADKRPFFSMKLVKGQTLADLLAARSGPAVDLPRYLSIFEAIAQTMAYTHTRGVIHRDLKPSNVMVGSFGEVQVMDWGLAKVLARGGVVNDAKAGKEKPPEPLIATARSEGDTDHSLAGSVMGTPSYMAPEQARGETDRLDERADVFAMGSILVEVLTGAPAFTGRTSGEILRKASGGDTADALARLGGCGAEAELIALAEACLAAEPEGRPHDANVVADRFTTYLAGVQERVRAAERNRAVAVAQAIEERRRRKVQLALAASLVAFATLGGLSGTYYLQQRAERVAAVDRVVGQAVTLRDQAAARPEDLARWEVALAAVRQAEAVGDEGAAPRLLALRAEVRSGLDAAKRDQALLDRLVDIRSAKADDPGGWITHHDYAEAFREAGIDLANLPHAEAGSKIKARPPAVAAALAGALDDWAATRRQDRGEAIGAAHLRGAASAADPDPWRIQLRTVLAEAGKADRVAGLQALAKEADFEQLGAISLQLLGSGLAAAADLAGAESVLRRAQQRYPRDVWVNYELAAVLEKRLRRDEAIRFYTAARAVRPETAHELAHALEHRGGSAEALAVFRDLKELRPGNARHLACLGFALKRQGLSRESSGVLDSAVAAFGKAIALRPDDASARFGLGNILQARGQLDEAAAAFRQGLEIEPDNALAYSNLGVVMHALRKIDEAVAVHRKAVELAPNNAVVLVNIGIALRGQGRAEEAEAAYRKAIALQPDLAYAHFNLGGLLQSRGQLDDASATFRRGLEIEPDDIEAVANLGAILCDELRDFPAAEALFRKAISLRPDRAQNHFNLGNALRAQGQPAEAAAAYRRAIEIEPDDALAHCTLGMALGQLGNYRGSLAEHRRGHELGSRQLGWQYPSARWIAEAEQLAARAERLPIVLQGTDKPKDNAERLAFARICMSTGRHAAAARFLTEALKAEPTLGDARQAPLRYDAACAAALAAAGQRKDDPGPDGDARAKLRAQALGWLKAELSTWKKIAMIIEPGNKELVAKALTHWRQDGDLATIRDEKELARLPEAERETWKKLWADVAALLKRVEKPTS